MNKFLSQFFVLAQRKYFFFISDSCCVWLVVLINISMLVIIIWSCKLIFLKNREICLNIIASCTPELCQCSTLRKLLIPGADCWHEVRGGGSYWFCDWWQKLEQDSSLLSSTVQPKSMIILLRIKLCCLKMLYVITIEL